MIKKIIHICLILSIPLASIAETDINYTTELESVIQNEIENFTEENGKVDKVNGKSQYYQHKRKQKRIQAGNDMINVGFEIMGKSLEVKGGIIIGVLVGVPIITVGTGVLVWGALTRDPTKRR